LYDVSPERTYVLDTVWQDERCAARANRIIAALGNTDVITIPERALPDVIRDNELTNVPERGNNLSPGEDPIFVLNRLRLGGTDGNEQIDGLLKKCPEGTTRHLVERLMGTNWTACGGPIRNEELICRRTNEFHTIHGCLHRCLYCMAGANQVIYSFFIDEIRKHDPTVPISLSTETKEVWGVLGPRLGFTPHNYVCGCGAKCTPGLQVLAQPETFQIGANA